MVNKVIIVGNLGKDPEIRHLEGGASVANFPVATNENYKDKNGEWQKITEWHDIVAWSGLAEYSERWLKKGSLVYVEGKLTHRKYQDKEGIERYSTDVRALSIRSLDKREPGPGSGDAPGSSAQGTVTNESAPQDESDDDLPF